MFTLFGTRATPGVRAAVQTRALRAAGGLALACALAGCGLLPPVPVFSDVNQRAAEAIAAAAMPSAQGPQPATTPTHAPVPRATERPGVAALHGTMFVGLGISGGGSRAASFGAAALQELESLGLMQHVSVLSSVSGGGLPTAWYALHGPLLAGAQAEGWDTLRHAMAQDFRTEWQHSVLAPTALLATFLSGINRSDFMVEVFERRLFHGATFADLGAIGPRRPIVLFNATDITREGVGFAFSEEEFSARNSRLDSYPIARAVMASGAFPGAFSSITLRNHPPLRPDGSQAEEPSYTHLMDGGPADNHGIDKLLQTARSAWQRSPDRAAFACLFVIVDAHVTNHASARATDRDLRNAPLDYLVDPNVFEAIDTLLVQRRGDSLARLGIQVPGTTRDRRRPSGGFHYAQADGGPERLVTHYERVTDFDLPVQDIEPGARPPRCRAWHVALNEIPGITSGVRSDASGLLDPADPVLRHRATLWEGVSRIRTDYRLTGLPGCSAAQMQAQLYRAARVAVREDSRALQQVCSWLGAHAGAAEGAACLAAGLPPATPPLPLRVSLAGSGTSVHSTVRCVPEAP